ncbi:envelope stress response membrane protein PspC [Candidatus Rariloculus sp.]|uniref:envelope stress response membrane protein PspC n=1 Tax=Candidatus Rariloculus sp. TaxID=3101265 RepID=UPI003D117731
MSDARGTTDMGRNKLYRDGERGMVAGVCAGLAGYFGFDLTVTRVVVVVGMFFFPTLIIVYFVLALLLKKGPKIVERSDEYSPDLERRVRAEPHATLSSVRHRFRDMDARLQRLEKYVTSGRFRLDREFENLKD